MMLASKSETWALALGDRTIEIAKVNNMTKYNHLKNKRKIYVCSGGDAAAYRSLQKAQFGQ
jgi:hypothetical protein